MEIPAQIQPQRIITGQPADRIKFWQIGFAVCIGLAIVAIELAFVLDYVSLGIGLSLGIALSLFIIISIPALHFSQKVVTLTESLALIPLYVLFTSSLPWFFLGQQYLLPAVYSIIIGLCLWHIYYRNLNLNEIFGFKVNTLLRYSLLGILLAIGPGVMEYLILTPPPPFPTFELKYLLRDLVYMVLFVGIGEELLFRGLIQRDLSDAFGRRWGLIGASVIFAVMHMTWRSSAELIFVFAAGMLLGYVYQRTRSLTASIVLHGVANTILVSVMPYLLR